MIDPLVAPKDSRALADVRPLLDRLVAAYGHNPIARLLDVDAAMITRWSSLGLWNRKQLRLKRDPEVLTLEHAAVQEAAALLPRHLEARRA